MSSESLKRIQAAFGAISQLPYCSGIVPLETSMSTLFYTKNGKAELINFTSVTDDQLAALAETCQQATFGVNDKDVLDESYRKAGKLDATEFATQFSPLTTGVVDIVKEQLLSAAQLDAEGGVRVELYKLNVYGPGSFFKAHVDTPRSEDMFGSLVVVLPTAHEGGSLIIRHGGQERVFDTSQAVNSQEKPHAAFIAFYSDVEHEVSLVTSGYRVTLTYNLYIKSPSEGTSISPLTSSVNPIEEMKHELKKLLQDPSFLPNGGYLGFGLSHRYPFKPSSDSLYQLDKRLKGSDAEVKRMCKALGLNVTLKAIYSNMEPGDSLNAPCCLVDRFIHLGDEEIEDQLLDYICKNEDNAVLVVPSGMGPRILENFGLEEGEYRYIVWIKPVAQTNNDFTTKYIAYGNEATMGYAYGDVCLVAEVRSKNLKYGAQINGSSALAASTHRGNIGNATYLLDHGADPLNEYGNWVSPSFPLHMAIQRGHSAMARLLLDNSADPNMKDGRDKNAFEIAREGGNHSNVAEAPGSRPPKLCSYFHLN